MRLVGVVLFVVIAAACERVTNITLTSPSPTVVIEHVYHEIQIPSSPPQIILVPTPVLVDVPTDSHDDGGTDSDDERRPDDPKPTPKPDDPKPPPRGPNGPKPEQPGCEKPGKGSGNGNGKGQGDENACK